MNKFVSVLLHTAGLVLIAVGLVYCTNPAQSLPHYLPGYDPGLDKLHYKHGLAALIFGIALFVYPWLPSRSRSVREG